jgi:hypothetical protein
VFSIARFPFAKAEIIVSERGTGSSNPSPSSGESGANLTPRFGRGSLVAAFSLQRDIGLSGVQLETNCAGLADHAAEREAIRLLAREVKSAFR